ncbi:unnamed protein product [Miscanthus lutarioriparius]|uniref:PIN-like protein n=1 Tax=Miscanthus lutarioriparius TaxID=422564 RepID=A0A811MRG0_9POAL|nr:unnamed protein product [Miscanthus lutarioriparius]
MRFWSLLVVAWLPVLQVLLVGLLGALLASSRLDVLTADARRNINKVVYIVFVPSLVFSSLSSTVTLKDILGNFYIWTHSYSVVKRSATLYKAKMRKEDALTGTSKEHFGQDAGGDYVAFLPLSSEDLSGDVGSNSVSSPLLPNDPRASFWGYYLRRAEELVVEILKELGSPPSVAAVLIFSVGAVDKVKSLVTEEGSPLRVIQDSTKLLGDATIPCTVLILGGNLTKIHLIAMTSCSIMLSIVYVSKWIAERPAATKLGLLPKSPLYRYVLLLQSTVPPAMSVGTIAQLFDVGEEECSIIFLWTHLVAALALTLWSTVFMSLVL